MVLRPAAAASPSRLFFYLVIPDGIQNLDLGVYVMF